MAFALLFASSYFSDDHAAGRQPERDLRRRGYLTQGELYRLGALTTGFCLLVFLLVGTRGCSWSLAAARWNRPTATFRPARLAKGPISPNRRPAVLGGHASTNEIGKRDDTIATARGSIPRVTACLAAFAFLTLAVGCERG
jgi:hypothetical protein